MRLDYLPVFLAAGMGIVLIYSLIIHTQTILQLPGEDSISAVDTNTASIENFVSKSALSVSQIAGFHLFGNSKVTGTKLVTPTVAPETRLKLTLFGVVAAKDNATGNAGDARAIIAGPDGKAKSIPVGGQIPGGAQLKEIYADRVILMRNGAFETLKLPKEKLSDKEIINRNIE
ncbi:MAG: hypothetical protein BMS9Abin26_1952 [Gammaproteobacteria bacterium]|nr:MAG: hypothetical protein BMS9Abin26_1952 [Gammaproteobacteria bacterium]